MKARQLNEFSPGELKEDDLYEDFIIKAADLSDNEALDVRFLFGRMEKVKLERTKLKQVKLADVAIDNSQLSNAKWGKSLFSNVVISNCKLTGFQAMEGKWTDTLIKECKLDLALLILTKMKKVIFQNCILTEVDFQECEMENVKFEECDLSGASFLGAKFKNVDLRGSKIEKIKMGVEQFPGIIIEPPQAAYLIGATGAKVKWLGDDEEEIKKERAPREV